MDTFDLEEYKNKFYLLKESNDNVLKHFDENNYDIYVYCSAKSGSSTLKSTFEYCNYKVLHLHSKKSFYEDKMCNYSIFDLITYFTKFNIDKKYIYIIDSYRTPIERKISSFFQNISIHVCDFESKSVEEIIEIFNNKYLYTLENYHSINQVFDFYGIEKFKEFDFENGYNLFQQENKIFIKLIFSQIDEWDKILSKIFGKNIELKSSNFSMNKKTSLLYKAFKNQYKIPSFYLYKVLTCDEEFKIYNTVEQQNQYIYEWEKKGTLPYNNQDEQDFNVDSYKMINKDLKRLSLHEACIHYIIDGVREKRKIK